MRVKTNRPAYAGQTKKNTPERNEAAEAAEAAEQRKQNELLTDAEKRDFIQRVRAFEPLWNTEVDVQHDRRRHYWNRIYDDMVIEGVLTGEKANGEKVNGRILRDLWRNLTFTYKRVSLA